MEGSLLATLTTSPAIDISTTVPRIAPTKKLRCVGIRRDPGGGGVNVARVFRRLQGEVVAVFPAGGLTGARLTQLVASEGVRCLPAPAAEETRENLTVLETETGQEYRFILPAPHLASAEWRACLAALEAQSGLGMIVASGGLAPGAPHDAYRALADIARRRGAKLVVDASGRSLDLALKAGTYLVKPNLSELSELVGRRIEAEADQLAACRELISSGGADVIALSRGAAGALAVSATEAWSAQALPVALASSVGAGDSFLAAFLWSLMRSPDLAEALAFGVAAGSAALMRPGTGLALALDILTLRDDVVVEPVHAAVQV